MNLDGLTMSVLAKEINERLQTGQIQKLYQIDKTTLLFKIRALNEDQNLIITVGATRFTERAKFSLYVLT